MRARAAALTVAVLLCGAVFGAAVALAATGARGTPGATTCALLWGVGLIVAFLAGFAARGRISRSAGAPDSAGGATGGSVPMDAVEAAEKTRATAKPVEPSWRGSTARSAIAFVVCLGLVGGLWALWPGDEPDRRPATKASAGAEPPAKPAVAWHVAATGDRYDEGPGAWGLGDTVVQGRVDGLSAYGVRDGAVRWSLPAPAREAVCAMSPGAAQGVGLIAYGKHDEPCATLVAVRTSDGKKLWTRHLKGDGLPAGGLGLGGSTAVAVEEGALRARSAETGRERWHRSLAQGCEPRAADADAARTLLVEQCGSGARLIALDTRTGKEQWARRLPVESRTAAAVVSVTPAVLAVSEDDRRGTRALLGFDDRGALTASVPLSGSDGDVVVPEGIPAGTGREGRPLVFGDLLVTLTERKELVPDVVVAHSLKDGHKVWEYRTDGFSTDALAREADGRIAVLVSTVDGGQVVLLDEAGAERGRIEPADAEDAALSISPELIPVTGGHVVVNHLSMSGEPAVFSLR